MRIAAVLALLSIRAAYADEAAPPRSADCVIRVGANDRVAQESTVVVKSGESVGSAVAIRGDVVVQRGGKVTKAIALGGNVTVEGGALIVQNAVAIGGDVRLAKGARVEKDAMAIGGQVRMAQGSSVAGAVLGLSLQLGQDLQSKILSELKAEGSSCRIERDPKS